MDYIKKGNDRVIRNFGFVVCFASIQLLVLAPVWHFFTRGGEGEKVGGGLFRKVLHLLVMSLILKAM